MTPYLNSAAMSWAAWGATPRPRVPAASSTAASHTPRPRRRRLITSLSSRERGRIEHRHDLPYHLFAAREPALFVAADRVLDDVHEAFVAVGAGRRRTIASGREPLHEIVVGDERPRDADAIAVAPFD